MGTYYGSIWGYAQHDFAWDLCWVYFAWALSLGSLRWRSFVWDPSLGMCRLGSFAWDLSLEIFHLGFLPWDLRLDFIAWVLSLGTQGLGIQSQNLPGEPSDSSGVGVDYQS